MFKIRKGKNKEFTSLGKILKKTTLLTPLTLRHPSIALSMKYNPPAAMTQWRSLPSLGLKLYKYMDIQENILGGMNRKQLFGIHLTLCSERNTFIGDRR